MKVQTQKRSFQSGLAFAAVAALSLVSQPLQAAVIAVVDSGTDLEHPLLAQKAWNNPGEIDDAVDNDDNGYIDDLHGWNIPENSNRLIDRKLIGTFPEDDYKFFEFQTKMLNGTATDDDVAWMKSKIEDKNFVEQLERFGNHVHGTHVAGIASRDADHAELMILRTIGGGEPSSFLGRLGAKLQSAVGSNGIKDKIIYAALDALALAQGSGMAPIGKYLASKKAQVANCSFGASRRSIEPLIGPLIEKILGKKLTDEELHAYSNYFLNKTVAAMKKALVDPSKNTLFVMAAGNDGTNNDEAPTAPANVKADNAITVAATLGHSKLASFSNYGAEMVDIAAPGVGIVSSVPGGAYMSLSGTSQATPFVANIAGRVIDANPKLAPVEVKKILMETVDKKAFLSNKVRSEGIANPDRALYAAQLSRQMAVDEAIHHANREIAPAKAALEERVLDDSGLVVLPLPSFLH